MARGGIDADRVAWFDTNWEGIKPPGEYRVTDENGKTDQRVVWVDESPDDPDDFSGHFEAFDGDVDDYQPIRSVSDDG